MCPSLHSNPHRGFCFTYYLHISSSDLRNFFQSLEINVLFVYLFVCFQDRASLLTKLASNSFGWSDSPASGSQVEGTTDAHCYTQHNGLMFLLPLPETSDLHLWLFWPLISRWFRYPGNKTVPYLKSHLFPYSITCSFPVPDLALHWVLS